MRITINVKEKHAALIILFIITASAIGLVVAYGGTNPSQMGHSWGEMACDKCIASSNLADSSVTGAKIQDGTVTSADIASIDGGKITGTVPSATNAGNADTLDGYHASSFFITCPCGSCWATSTDTSDCAHYGATSMCTPAGWKPIYPGYNNCPSF